LVDTSDGSIRLLLVISNLSYAGSQRQLLTLATHLDKSKIAVEVCTLSTFGELEPEFLRLGIPLWRVTKKHKWDPGIFFRFADLCRRRCIQVVYSYLDFDNLVARLGGKLAKVPAIITSERNAYYSLPLVKDFLDRLTAGLSDMVVVNSLVGKEFLIRNRKINANRIKVIRNGLDPHRFNIDHKIEDFRYLHSIPHDAFLIGMAAERRPQKNFDLFFRVAETITEKYPRTWFVQVGGSAPTYHGYAAWVEHQHDNLTCSQRTILAGRCYDMEAFYHAIDILIMTSDYEGFSNVVMEAMALGLPMVVTDVGDNRDLIHDQGGFVCPIGDEQAMVSGISRLIENPDLRSCMGQYNRKRASELFLVQRMVSETEAVIFELYESKMKSS
jgi:glycosyltransferase involved in cell wall biosynthesis